MNGRNLFQKTICGQNYSGRPPIWVMRQAGRYLPEYRALKEKHTFVEMVRTPELAVEVTLQPLRRFSLDAAIMFSDILVIPEAMGQEYSFRPTGGIEMTHKLENEQDIANLDEKSVGENLSYVEETLKLLRAELGNEKALLGFCGSPWTLACYMIEGGSAEGFPKALKWADENPVSFHLLLEKITYALADYLAMQAKCGVDALQIFDSWLNICPEDQMWELSLKWIAKLIDLSPVDLPIIVYANTKAKGLTEISKVKPQALGVHHGVDLAEIRKMLPTPLVLQGNLDPEIMSSNPENVRTETLKILESLKEDPAHIMNLGHGIRPNAKIECMEELVETVISFA